MSNISKGKEFILKRFSSGYGEEYDYNSILHYSATAFSKALLRSGDKNLIDACNVKFS